MIIKNDKELEGIRKSGRILAAVLDLVANAVKPGVSAYALDQIAETEILKRGAKPAFKNYQPDQSIPGFPGSLCVSVNDEVVHGIPSKEKILKNGDIVGLDLGVNYQGFFTDMAVTVPVGKTDKESLQLIEAATEGLTQAIASLSADKTTGDIGAIIEAEVKKYNFKVVRDLVGHGVGAAVHEDPEIPCYGRPGAGKKFIEGMVVAIEPMVNAHDHRIYFGDDMWTVRTADGSRSAHMEHTLLVTKTGCEVITKI